MMLLKAICFREQASKTGLARASLHKTLSSTRTRSVFQNDQVFGIRNRMFERL